MQVYRILIVLVIATNFATAAAQGLTHLELAVYLKDNIRPKNNTFATNPSYLLIPGYHDVEEVQSRNKCATFITNLLKIVYNATSADFKAWTGSTSPYAFMYFNLVRQENGFEHLADIRQVQPGDFHFEYKNSNPNSIATGHSMVVTSYPEPISKPNKYCFTTVSVSNGGLKQRGRCVSTKNYLVNDDHLIFGRLTKFKPARKE